MNEWNNGPRGGRSWHFESRRVSSPDETSVRQRRVMSAAWVVAMGTRVVALVDVIVMVALIVGLDGAVFRHHFLARFLANVGMVLLVGRSIWSKRGIDEVPGLGLCSVSI